MKISTQLILVKFNNEIFHSDDDFISEILLQSQVVDAFLRLQFSVFKANRLSCASFRLTRRSVNCRAAENVLKCFANRFDFVVVWWRDDDFCASTWICDGMSWMKTVKLFAHNLQIRPLICGSSVVTTKSIPDFACCTLDFTVSFTHPNNTEFFTPSVSGDSAN